MASHGDGFSTAFKFAKSFLWAAKKMAAPFLQELRPFSGPPGVDEDALKNLRTKLDKIRATLHDAEQLEIRDESVKLWLSELRDLEYMAADILEEFEFELEHTRRLHELCVSTAAGKRMADEVVLPILSPDLSCLRRKIEAMTERCDEVAADRQALRLRTADGKRRGEGTARPPSSSFCDGELHGREEDLKEVKKLLLSDEKQSGCAYSVVAIIGMTGIGKTALVQHVYNNNSVASTFDLRIWVWVSVDFDATSITKAIIEGITIQRCVLSQLNVLQEVLGDLLAEKRFMLVFDELWNVNQEHWETLQKPFKRASRGSKVIITSQSIHIAKIMGVHDPYRLSFLSDESCQLICQARAFQGRENLQPSMSCIEKDFAMKSKGLPLAAKALGDILRSEFGKESLTGFLQNHSYANDEFVNRVLPVLRMSYDNLPAHLKRCFVYCSLFPKDYIFEKHQLVRLWIAQGFVVSHEVPRLKNIEDIGGKYFDDLVGRSFFQHSPFYDVSEERFVMHDLFHELAQSISGNEFSRLEDYKFSDMHYRTRHSSLAPCGLHSKNRVQLEPFDGQDLRTLLFIGRLEYKLDELAFNIKIAEDLFLRLECLRALDLRNTDIAKLPNSVGSLKHLRYLCLENTRIRKLPDPLCYLYNLQTLDLKHCYHLEELPHGMQNLSNLRHLDLPLPDHSDVVMPSGVGKLIHLQTLPAFIVGSNTAHCGLAELKGLVDLRGQLHISGLNNVSDAQDAEAANLKEKEKLHKITLQWFSWFSSSRTAHHLDGELEFSVLERLQPHYDLQELNIRDYYGVKFPKWIGDPFYTKLVNVNLQDCARCIKLPPLGQLPSLRCLTIQMMNGVECIGREFCGSGCAPAKGFPKLEKLEIRKMSEWEVWCEVEDGDFRCLSSLIISGCPKLRILPQLNELRILEIGSCEQLSSGGNQHHLINLQQLKVIKCPLLNFSWDMQLALKLEVVYIHGVCPMLDRLTSNGFESTCCQEREGLKFIRSNQANRNSKRPADCGCNLAEGSMLFRNKKPALKGKDNFSGFDEVPDVCHRCFGHIPRTQYSGIMESTDQDHLSQKIPTSNIR